MSMRLDNVLFTTTHESYKNYASPSAPLAIPADVIPNGTGNNYSVLIPYARGGTRADTYLDGNSVKILANASTRLATGGPYQFKSTETASILVDYDDTNIAVTISIFNGTGGPITLTSQTITVSVVQYDAPITPI